MNDIQQHSLVRGGARQRAKAFEHLAEGHLRGSSVLVELLLDLFVWGLMTASTVQRILAAATADIGASGQRPLAQWELLSKIGASGIATHNMKRDLLRKLPKSKFDLCPKNIPLKSVPLKGQPGRVTLLSVPMLLPTMIFQGLHEHGMLLEMLCPDRSAVAGFWSECGQHPALRFHPVKKISGYEHRAIPLCLHGDAAPVTSTIGAGSKTCLFLSSRSLLCDNPFGAHFLMTAVWSHAFCKHQAAFQTNRAIFKIISQDFLSLMKQEGKHTSGYFGVPVFTTGDLEYFADHHQIARWNAASPCPFCPVQKDALGNTKGLLQIEPDAWQPLPRTSVKCPLFYESMSPVSITPDWMHTKHLGIDQRFLGSVLWILISLLRMQRGASMEESLADVFREMRATWPQVYVNLCLFHVGRFYSKAFWSSTQDPSSLSNLTLGMLSLDKQDPLAKRNFPKLKVKAAETGACLRSLVPICQAAMHKHGGEQWMVWVKIGLQQLSLMEQKLRDTKEQWRLSAEDTAALLLMYEKFQTVNKALHLRFAAKGHKAFQFKTMKHHWLQHSLQSARWIHPLKVWCYSGEDYMRTCKALLASCLVGRSALSSQRFMMERYVVALAWDLEKRKGHWLLK